MTLEYVVTKRVFGFDQPKTERYVARSVDSGQVRLNEMCARVSCLRGIHYRVIDLMVSGLVNMMAEDIDDGKAVQTGEFRLSRPTIKTKNANIVEEVDTSNILSRHIMFMPGKTLHRTLEEMNVIRSVPVDTDYTDGSGNSGNTGSTDGPNEGSEEEDPLG